ncbi:SRPBCC family protein [Actinokineospora sp. HUAS TT18]|uniref:SRPBCC family protein n=1 Tax=Actinokineospora sp. HUAS TT18 TaxID=3447451 RepID=UPI003F51CA22
MTQGTGMSVLKTITVRASQERAFTVFATRMGSWWPAAHHIGEADFADVVIEPRVGGRWFERGHDGVECEWGRVLAYDPHDGFVLAWHLQGDWEYDPDPARASEVEVRFIPDGPTTRVELEHRRLERHGESGDDILASVGSDNGWSHILLSFSDAVED